MANNSPLFVPIKVDTFLINRNVLGNTGINVQRWKYMYGMLPNFLSPVPAPFNYNANLAGTGAILHWRLPEIIRNGTQNADGAIDYPLAPNRWLVIRYNGPANARTAVAWIVESDFLGNNDPVTGGAPYIQPGTNPPQPTFIGQVVSLSNWTEPNPPQLFLKAFAPGNAMFASFQPFCQNVFSIYDPLTGIPVKDTLSYMVAGWYSNPADDITGSWIKNNISFDDFLTQAGWQMAANPGKDTSTWSVYHSMNWNIAWDINGPAPSNVPDPSTMQVAVGNTTVDALTALIRAQAIQQGSTVDPDLLEALQYGLLPHYDQPDTAFELKEDIERSWFGMQSGGYTWEIVDAPVDPAAGDPPPPLSQAEKNAEDRWLAALNLAQANYDQDVETLAQLQWNLYQTWWKYNFLQKNPSSQYPEGTSLAQFQKALNPDIPTSLVSQVNTLRLKIEQAGISNEIPVGSTQDELQAAIKKYAASMNLPATRLLKQLATPPFAKGYDPVVLVKGLNVDSGLTANKPLVCRFQSDLVTGFKYNNNANTITGAQVQSAIPSPPGMSSVFSQLLNLLQEFFLLDPGNATMIAKAALNSTSPAVIGELADAMLAGKNVIGVAPDLPLQQWTQPWAPLVMLWQIVWYPIPHDNNTATLWSFDGNDYTWDGNNLPDNPVLSWQYSGSIFMTPQAAFNFKSQMEKYVKDNPEAKDVKELNDFITQTDSWDFLSQSLAGLTQLMTLRNPDPNMSAAAEKTTFFPPNITLSTLVGNSATYVPEPGLQQPPFEPLRYQNWRAGQFYIKQLVIADRFGQLCEIVNDHSEEQLSPYLPVSLTPQHPVIPNEPYRFIQLPPRLTQPARLNLDFVDCADDNKIIGVNPNVNPVCAWLLHDYLDESIAVYDNNGTILGAVWVVTNDAGLQIVNWTAAPGSEYQTIPDLKKNKDLLHLERMLAAVVAIGPTAFQSLLQTIDEAVWTIDSRETTSDQGLVLLAGKPIALARMRIGFEMQGEAISDPSWRYTFAPASTPVTEWNFTVRLGEAGKQADGLIGYFTEKDYEQLYTSHIPKKLADPNYILDIGTGVSVSPSFTHGSAALITVLMDPRSVLHATSGIVPVISTGIPQHFVTSAFAHMEVTFSVGPLLSETIQPSIEKPGNRQAYTMPSPSVKNGTWSWLQVDKGKWNPYNMVDVNTEANFSNLGPVIREGLLCLAGALRTLNEGNPDSGNKND